VPHLVDLAVVDKLLDEERALVLGKGFREKGHAVIGELFGQPCPVCTTRACTGAAAAVNRGHSAGAGTRQGGSGHAARARRGTCALSGRAAGYGDDCERQPHRRQRFCATATGSDCDGHHLAGHPSGLQVEARDQLTAGCFIMGERHPGGDGQRRDTLRGVMQPPPSARWRPARELCCWEREGGELIFPLLGFAPLSLKKVSCDSKLGGVNRRLRV